MALTVSCPNPKCGKSYPVSADYLGRRGRCKSCGTEFVFSATNSGSERSVSQNRSADLPAGVKSSSSQASTRRNRSQVPTRLGRFQILERVGMGGFGAVYRAQDPQLQRTVALKLLQSTGDDQRDQHRIDRFLVEGRAGARLQHPNIVPVFDAGKDKESGEYYLAAAFITGQPLSTAIDGKPLDLKRAATIVSQLAHALDYAHRQGILHRDVKPDNVMLDEKDVPHLMDFGLARMEESESHLTRDGAVLGTPSYMSPEQCVGKQDALGPAADQYSLGCVLYELLTGEKLFDGPVSVQIHHQLNTEAPPPSKKNSAIAKDLDTICLKTLAKEPERRYASCAALAADLEHWQADEPIQARQLTTWERCNRWRRRNPAIAGLSTGLVAALLIGLLGISSQWIRAEGNALKALLAAEQQKKAKDAAEVAKTAAEAAEQTAVAERHGTQKSLAESYVQRGRFHCLQGDVAQGLLLMARGLKSLPADESKAADLIALRIGSWEPRLPKRKLLVQHDDAVWTVRFEPRGTWFVTGGRDRTARIWDTATGQPLCPPLLHEGDVNSLDVSPDGNQILTCSSDGTVRLWKAPTGEPIGAPIQHGRRVWRAVFLEGGVIVVRTEGQEAHFWDAEMRQARREPVKLRFAGALMTATPDRKHVVLADPQECIVLDADGNEVGPRITNMGIEEVRAVAISPDGQTILLGGTTGVSRRSILSAWEFAGERKFKSKLLEAASDGILDAAFSPDGQSLFTGTLGATAMQRSSKTFERVGYRFDSPDSIRTIASHPAEKMLLTAGNDKTAILWSLPPQPERFVIHVPGGVHSVVFSPDDQRLLSAGRDGAGRLWDAKTGAAIGHPMRVQGIAWYCDFSPDGQLAAIAGGAIARIFNGYDGTPVGDPLMHPKAVMGVAFHPNGRTLLTGCDDGIARLWDVKTHELVGQTEDHRGKIWPVAFSPDGTKFATGCGADSSAGWGQLRVWRTDSRDPVAGPMVHHRLCSFVEFSRSKPWIVTACGDGLVQVWDYEAEKVVRGPFRHPAGAAFAVFDPSERRMATSSTDGHVRFWDLESQQQYGPDLLHGEWAVGLSFTSDGRRLATGSLDGTIRIWDVPQPATGTPEEIERRIQRATGLSLTERGDSERMDAQTWLQLAPETTSTTD